MSKFGFVKRIGLVWVTVELEGRTGLVSEPVEFVWVVGLGGTVGFGSVVEVVEFGSAFELVVEPVEFGLIVVGLGRTVGFEVMFASCLPVTRCWFRQM